LCGPRPGWKQKIEEQGLVFSTTTMDDGRKIEYWNESAYYEFTMDEVEALEVTAEDMHKMCKEAARFLASGAMGHIGIGPQALELAAESTSFTTGRAARPRCSSTTPTPPPD
jgi:glutathionylspermidine synthase